MKAMQQDYPIGELCAAFGVSRSGYQRWRKAAPSPRRQEDAQLQGQIRQLHQQSRQTYGRPRLTAALRKNGERCSAKRVRRLMQAEGVRGIQRGRFRPQTTKSGDRAPAPNRLLQRAVATRSGEVWVADICLHFGRRILGRRSPLRSGSFVPTREGWLYVAGVMDQGSRRIVGLAFGSRIDTALCESALRQALAHRRADQPLIHHSDQGQQYASARYRELLETKGITQSMSRKANCYDNAHMESFWATLKTECRIQTPFITRESAQLAVFTYVHTFYNRVRLHSAIGFQFGDKARENNRSPILSGQPQQTW